MKILEISMLFVGSIIGAGFATGAEIVTFFGKFSLPVWCIALLVGLSIFGFISITIFLWKPEQKQTSNFLSYIFVILYFVFFVAMTAGVIQIAGVFFGVLSLIISGLIVMFGFDKLTIINTFIVISIIIVLFGICIPFVRSTNTNFDYSQLPSATIWVLLYGGLNCYMFPELISASSSRHKKSTLYISALVTSVIISLFVFLILTAIKFTGTENAIMPLLVISRHPITFVVILLAIITSQYSAMFAIVQKTKKMPIGKKISTGNFILLLSIVAFACSFLGFEKILSTGYPLIGAFICFFLFSSLILYFVSLHKIRRQFSHQKQPHH